MSKRVSNKKGKKWNSSYSAKAHRHQMLTTHAHKKPKSVREE